MNTPETNPPSPRIAVICVGNKLMLDEGIGPAAYEELTRDYLFPDSVTLFDAGCMTLDMISYVQKFDLIITVDAVDGTDHEPGTILRYMPEDVARRSSAMQSLHDLKLIDLFDAAQLLGYQTNGLCLGMQVENMSPAELTVGLTPKVYKALPKLIDTVLAELTQAGASITVKETGKMVDSAHTHVVI